MKINIAPRITVHLSSSGLAILICVLNLLERL